MQTKLIHFLRKSAEKPFAYGTEDCCLWLANWWKFNHGTDPAHWLRGTYSTEASKDAIIAEHRGLQRLVTRIAREAGAVRTYAPTTGDFGLIALQGRPYGAICSGVVGGVPHWVVRAIEPSHVALSNQRILRAWSIHVGRNLDAPPARSEAGSPP